MNLTKQFFKYVSQNIFGLLGTSCYILADTYFIAQAAGTDGVTLLNLCLPIYNFIFAIGSMIALGSATRYAIAKAQNDARGQRYFSNAILCAVLASIPWMLAGVFAPGALLRLMGGDAGIVALGMTFVIISGGIDLAVGSTMTAVGAVLMVIINGYPTGLLTSVGITGPWAYVIGIAAALVVGSLVGVINGSLIAYRKLPPFIVTLGMMKICRSVTQQCMQKVSVKVPAGFLAIANTKIGGETILPILYWLIIAAILYVVSKHTPFGRQIYAIGSNERTARLSGVNVEKVKTWIYVLMGALVSVTAVIQIARIGSMDYANAGSGYEMDAIAAVVVGGTSMSGGKGSIGGTVLGMLIIAVMNNLLNLMGVPPFLREAFKGAIVIVAVLLQRKEK